jgi:glycosyltransferase involved in cell wall biosynthesis
VGTANEAGRPKVVIWRNFWLAHSETFVRDQTLALQRWSAVRVGFRSTEVPLLAADLTPYPNTLWGKVAMRLPGQPGGRRQLRRIVEDPDVQLVHAHFAPDGLSALPYARRAGKPLLVTFHGMDITRLPARPGLRGWWYRRRLRTLFAEASLLIAVSDFVGRRLIALGAPRDKVVVHHIGVPVRAPSDHSQRRPGIVFVGRLVPKKGVDDLLQAVAALPEPLRTIPVTIIGYGPLDASLQELARQLGVNARFTGRRTSAEIASELASHTVFCGPSRVAPDGDSEGFGLVFLEAAQQALPTVAYAHGGVVEAVRDGETGWLVTEGDISALSERLERLLTDPVRAAEMGQAGQSRVATDFSIDSQTAKLELLYDHATRHVLLTRVRSLRYLFDTSNDQGQKRSRMR